MRAYQFLCEDTDYDPAATWLHGGPAELQGGHFARGSRGGRDMGGIFLTRESPAGWLYAIGYMIARHPRGGAVWRCRITLPADQVLDFTNAEHRRRLEKGAPQAAASLIHHANGGHLPWLPTEHTAALEQAARASGFGGVILQERKGAQTVLSVCVFDPAHIEIIGAVPKAEAMQRYGRTPLGGGSTGNAKQASMPPS